MQKFDQRLGTSKPTYDLPMPANGDSWGHSTVTEGDGKQHSELTHAKVWISRADDPGTPCSVTIVWGNIGGDTEGDTPVAGSATETFTGAYRFAVPTPGLVSVVSDDGHPLNVYADVFGVWGG